MKNSLLLLSLAWLLPACHAKQESNIRIFDVPIENRTSDFKGKIPTDHPVMLMTMEKSKYSWADLDRYYRDELPREKEKDYYANVKNTAFSVLVGVHGLAEKAPKEVIAFYVEEQSAMPYTHAVEEYVTCLDALRGYWPDDKIRQYAIGRYEKTQSYYQNSTVLQGEWEKKRMQYAPLLGE